VSARTVKTFPQLAVTTLIQRPRTADCVFAEDEAQLLIGAARTPADLAAMAHRRTAGVPLERVLGWAEFCGLRIAGLSVRALARKYGVHRRMVREALSSAWPAPRKKLPPRKSRLDPFKDAVDRMLVGDLDAPRKQRHTVRRIVDRVGIDTATAGDTDELARQLDDTVVVFSGRGQQIGGCGMQRVGGHRLPSSGE
jgi:hypothetical protein